MKTTTKIIVAAITLTYLFLFLVSTFTEKKTTREFLTTMRAMIVADEIESVQSAVSINPYSDKNSNYVLELVADDTARHATVDYPSEILEVSMKGKTLDITTAQRILSLQTENRSYLIVSNNEGVDGVDTDDRTSGLVVVTVRMPKAMLLKFLRKMGKLDLQGGKLSLKNLRLDVFSIHKDIDLLLENCMFKQAVIDVESNVLQLFHTHIGTLTFYGKLHSNGDYDSTVINEMEGVRVDSLVLRTSVDMNLDYDCYGHIKIETADSSYIRIGLDNISGSVTLK